MAFNPFSVFHRYRKFWMAAILLMTMVTFILCAGDVQSIVASIAGALDLGQGEAVVTIKKPKRWYNISSTKGIHGSDISQLKEQRELANQFMKAATELSLKRADSHVRKLQEAMRDKKNLTKENQSELQQAVALRSLLHERLKPERYFGTGVKLQDLVDFVLWQNEAKKLNINLTEELVKIEFMRNMYRYFSYQEDFPRVLYQVQENTKATPTKVLESLKQEFEVEIAKLALMGVRPAMYDPNAPPHEMDIRSVFTPEQLFSKYQKDRTTFNVALLPIDVHKFVEKVPEPTQDELEKFFKKYQKKIADPTSDTPGFTTPERIKIQYLVADAKSPYYDRVTDALVMMQKYPLGLRAINPIGLGGVAAVVSSCPAWETWIYNKYQADRTQQRAYYARIRSFDPEITDAKGRVIQNPVTSSYLYLRDPYLQVPLGDPNFVLPMYTKVREPEPFMVASLIGNLSGADAIPAATSYQAGAILAFDGIPKKADKTTVVQSHPPLIQEAIDIELERRAPVGVTLMLSLANPHPFGLVSGTAVSFAAQAGLVHAQPPNSAYYASLIDPKKDAKKDKKDGKEKKKGSKWDDFKDNQERNQFLPISLPLPLVMKEFTDQYKLGLAQESVRQIIEVVQTDEELGLDTERARGKRGEFKARLNRLLRKYKGILQLSDPTDFVTQYDVESSQYVMAKPKAARDPRLVALRNDLLELRKSFANQKILDLINRIEGRPVGTERHLSVDDFPKLFFDRTESFSIGTKAPFFVRAWPPVATADPKFMLMGQDLGNQNLNQRARKGQPIDLLNAGFSSRPAVFWEVDQKGRETPKSLAAVREKVIQAWKFQKAREKAFEEAKRIVQKIDEYQRLEKEFVPLLQKEADKLGTQTITLRNVAKKVPDRGFQGGTLYKPYELPKGIISHARADTTKRILSLNTLSEPLKTADPNAKDTRGEDAALDQLNTKLHDTKLLEKGVKQPQVLTNKPRSVYYVAVIPPDSVAVPRIGDYRARILLRSVGQQGQQANSYLEQARMEMNKDIGKLLVQQLRDQANVKYNEEARKRYED